MVDPVTKAVEQLYLDRNQNDDPERKRDAFLVCNGARRDETWNTPLACAIREAFGNSIEKVPVFID